MREKVRFADKLTLIALNRTAEKMNYNRQIVPESLEALPDDALIAIMPIMIHEHAQGKLVKPHLRCSLQVSGQRSLFPAMLDVPMDLYESLPETELTPAETP